MYMHARGRYGVCCVLLVAVLTAAFDAFAVPNPVLPGTADVGVFRFNGRYYLMGVGSSGGFFVSDDLLYWSGQVHAFSMNNDWATGPAATDDNIHACDIRLVNGRFNLYWSVNCGELRQIGRAEADGILGPYAEPERSKPFDGRIDPNLFVDDDGAQYFYTVKFNFGNWIYGQRMADSAALAGAAIPLLTPVPGTWELRDEPVNEGPFVIRYRDTCYLLYNANHTALRYGNYAIGCAAARGPMDFSNQGKYPYPVLDKKAAGDNGGTAVHNCGQPSLVRGPNWFEWWLVYFAVYGDSRKRCQAVDRVHFLDRELVVDGPTTSSTSGTHPDPAMPVFRDLFAREASLAEPWTISGGEWIAAGGEVRQKEPDGLCRANLNVPAAVNYVFETGLRFLDKEGRQAGLVAWDDGRQNSLYVGLDHRKGAWFWMRRRGFAVHTETQPLPPAFNWDGWHQLAVVKNGGSLSVLLDGIPAPGRHHIPADGCGAGRPGLVTRDGAAVFGPVSYSVGWDEFDGNIGGWVEAACDSPAVGTWKTDHQGLLAKPLSGEARAFKGDAMQEGELSVQVWPEQGGASVECGVYPVHAGEDNAVRVALDGALTRVSVSGKRDGMAIPELSAAIVPRQRRLSPLQEGGCNLRILRRNDRLVLFVDGVETLTVPGTWPPAQVGLFAAGGTCRFNSITCFERGNPAK